VTTWICLRLKFQADMGVLLTFMFLWNMIGALTLLPALVYYLFRDSGKAAGGVASAEQAG